jgi:hypothetical protein
MLVPGIGKARLGGLFFALFALCVLAGCARIASRVDPGQAPATGETTVFGRMGYVVDGAARPAWPAPFLDAVRLETGEALQTHAVDAGDGSFRWAFPPGSYVVTRIGAGTFTDDTYIAWPRVAFRVPAGGSPVYLGHLVLEGTSYSEDYVLSTGKKATSRGVRFSFRVRDELASGTPKSLFFHDAAMPAGDTLMERWRADREGLIRGIFR